MDNIIQFPVERRFAKVNEKEKALEDMADEVAADVLHYLLSEGMKMDDPKHMYHVSLFFESLRSMIFWVNNIYHPVQILAGEIYENVVFENDNQLELF